MFVDLELYLNNLLLAGLFQLDLLVYTNFNIEFGTSNTILRIKYYTLGSTPLMIITSRFIVI